MRIAVPQKPAFGKYSSGSRRTIGHEQTSSPRSFRDTSLGFTCKLRASPSSRWIRHRYLFVIGRAIFFQHCNETEPSTQRQKAIDVLCKSVRSELGRCFLRAWVAHAPVTSDAIGLSPNFFCQESVARSNVKLVVCTIFAKLKIIITKIIPPQLFS